MKCNIKFKKNDEYYTPDYAVYPILEKIKKFGCDKTIWCPFDKECSEYVNVFKKAGYHVINTHIDYCQDFLTIEPPDCDYIISNPPYSKKYEVFKRLFEIGKPFAMLVNVKGLFDCKERFELFENNKFEVLFLYPRVHFIQNVTHGSPPFQMAYITNNILDNTIEFCHINRNGRSIK